MAAMSECVPIHRVLVTGAAGQLGSVLRARLAGRFPVLRLSDRVALGTAGDGEELVECELGDAQAMERLLVGVDAVVHLGGQPVEADWPVIVEANIRGAINLWEAAHKAGCRRIVFASSNHVTGFYPCNRRIDEYVLPRPDTRYGVSKAFGEDLARYYADKFGIRAFCIRIGSCVSQPLDERMLATWLSPHDFVQLVMVGLTADYHFEIVYGVSANSRGWWDNTRAEALGYRPQDNAEAYVATVDGRQSRTRIADRFQGGSFCECEFAGDPDKII
jgi:uronate dehydrogenase